MSRIAPAIIGSLLCLSACSQSAAAEEPPAYLKKDLTELVTLFEGRWDNDRHNFFAEDAGLDLETLSPRQHIVVERQEAGEQTPEGEVVFTTKRTVKGEDPAVLVHRFSADGAAGGIRHTFSAPGGVMADQAFNCTALWTRSGGGFEAKASGSDCAKLFPRPSSGGALDVSMKLSEEDFWVTAKRGDQVTEARMRKARPFSCWVAVLRGEEHGTTGEGKDDWTFDRGILLHDQYGEAIIETDETPSRNISLRIRNVDWPYGTNRPSMTLYVHEAGNDRAISYAWTEYNAERIGINLRWLQASCTHSPDDMFADF